MRNLLLSLFSVHITNEKIASKKIKILEQLKPKETENKLHSVKHLPSLSILSEHNLRRRINEHKVKVKRIEHELFIEHPIYQISSNQSNEKSNFLLWNYRMGKPIMFKNNRFQYNYI
jgi:hypothetical protein